jgi:DNA polymerase elongation subunit (family B)
MPDEKLIITDKLQKAMKEYEKIIKEANYLSRYDFVGELTNRDYIEYIIREGSIKARRDLIETMPIPKKLHNRKLHY